MLSVEGVAKFKSLQMSVFRDLPFCVFFEMTELNTLQIFRDECNWHWRLNDAYIILK